MLRQHPGDYQLTSLCDNYVLASLPLTMRSGSEAYAVVLKAAETRATWEHGHYEAVNHRSGLVPLEVVVED